MEILNDVERTKLAKKIAARKRSFIENVLSYIAVNSLLVLIYFLFDNSTFWSIWPLIGWGTACMVLTYTYFHKI